MKSTNPSPSNDFRSPSLWGDAEVIAACLRGEEAAWSELYFRFHDRLIAAIRSMLRRVNRPQQIDDNLVEEIAARVWYMVVREDHKLLRRFDVERGVSLATFLGVIAKSQVWQHFRSERRRRLREAVASKQEELGTTAEDVQRLALEETFLNSLSRAELKFYHDVLTHSPEDPDESAYTPENRWQLRHRILMKLRDACDEELPGDIL